MKFSTALGMGLALAPLSMASDVHNALVSRNMKADLIERTNHANKMVSKVNKQVNNHNKQVNQVNQGNGASGQATQVIILWVQSGGGERTKINQKSTITETKVAGGGQTAVNPAQAGATKTVTVGGPGGMLQFQPEEMQANVGDVVVMKFMAKNHSATQSTFGEPCVPMAGGKTSGFLPNPENIGLDETSGNSTKAPEFAIQVLDTAPTWWFCGQTGHCGKGMVFSINATPEKSHATFKGKATNNGTGVASPITGGEGQRANAGGGSETASSSSIGGEAGATSVAGGSETQPTGTIGAGSGAGGETAPGMGTVNADGSCNCVAACAAGAFPAAQMQGVGSFGGVAGSLSVNVNMTSKRR